MSTTSLRERLLQTADDREEPEKGSEGQKQEQQQQQKPPVRTKEDNLASLRKAKEEQEEMLKSLQGENLTLKEKAAKLEDERFQKLLEKLETDYEGDPEKFLGEHENLRTNSGEWETKLREKEELLERTAFEKSAAYQKNVAAPIKSSEELLKGVLKKDDQLFKELMKNFVYNKDGKVINGTLTADEIIALDDVLDNHDGLKPERVKVAIENLREKFHEANDYYSNFQSKVQSEEADKQRSLAEKNAQEAGIAKLARAQAIKVGASQLLADEDLKSVLPEEFLTGLPRVVLTSVESTISSRVTPSLEQMAQNQMKALLYDELVKNGGLKLLREAIGTQSEHSRGSEGTRSSTRAPQQKATGSIIEHLAQANGVDRRIRQ